MCGVCVNTCFCKPNQKTITREQHSAKLGNVLTPIRLGNRRTNDITPNCATITKTNMADIYTDARAHNHDSGKCIRLLFMEYLNCTCAETFEYGQCSFMSWCPPLHVWYHRKGLNKLNLVKMAQVQFTWQSSMCATLIDIGHELTALRHFHYFEDWWI